MISDTEQSFMCLLIICFILRRNIYLSLSTASSLYILYVNPHQIYIYMCCKYFSPVLWVAFYSVDYAL